MPNPTKPEANGAGTPIDGSLKLGIQVKERFFQLHANIPTGAGDAWEFELWEGADPAHANRVVGVHIQDRDHWYIAGAAPDGALRFGDSFGIPVLQIGVAKGAAIPDDLGRATAAAGALPSGAKNGEAPVAQPVAAGG